MLWCHWRLANGTITEILSFLDDRSCYALSVSAHDHINTSTVIGLFRETANQHGLVGPGHIPTKSSSRRVSEPSSGALGCRKLCRGWSGGVAVFVYEAVASGRFNPVLRAPSPTEPGSSPRRRRGPPPAPCRCRVWCRWGRRVPSPPRCSRYRPDPE